MTKTAQDIIIRPIITEASMGAQLFGVKVAKVNTMNVKGQLRRQGRFQGYRPDWKKAVVTLKEDSKGIEFFESMA